MSDEQNKPRMMYNPAFPDSNISKPHSESSLCRLVDPNCIPYEESVQKEANKQEPDNV